MTLLDHATVPPTPAPDPRRAGFSGLHALLGALDIPVTVAFGRCPAPVPAGHALVLVADGPLDAVSVGHARAVVDAGGRVLLAGAVTDLAAFDPAMVPDNTAVLAAPDPTDPLVWDEHLVALGRDALADHRIETDDFTALAATGAPLATVGGQVVMSAAPSGRGTVVILGSSRCLGDRWLAAADNAVAVAWAVSGRMVPVMAGIVSGHIPRADAERLGVADHAEIAVTDNGGDDALLALLPDPATPTGSPAFVRAAGRAGRLLSAPVHDALVDLADGGAPAGAILLRNLPVGEVPPTPDSPDAAITKDHTSELVLLAVARRLGQPVGYAPEHGGDIVQNLLPTRRDQTRQTSTSSAVELEFHTETAFHRHKPRYLVLLCLRGDPEALTMLCSISEVLDHLPLGVAQTLREPRFRTAVDESFGARPSGTATVGTVTGTRRLGHPVAVLAGSEEAPSFTFDADLMEGTDPAASAALETLRQVVRRRHIAVALRAGDLLVVDNSVAVHGRSPFSARFDGTDRWLQRTFVVTDLAASATERRDRVITTRFA